MSRLGAIALAVAATALVAACGEKVQTTSVGPAKKSDATAWSGGESPYRVSGWTPGDRASWEAQMRARAQGQDDYAQR
jgi:hypothetical protein